MPRMPKSPPKLSRMTAGQREVYEKALHAVSLSRHRRLPLPVAAREAHTTPTAVLRYARAAFTKRRGEWVTKPRDQLERQMLFYDRKGSYAVTVRSSTSASRIGEYHNAVRRFLETGDDSRIRPFEGKSIVDARGRRHRFLTDPDAIRRLARAGTFGFDSIY